MHILVTGGAGFIGSNLAGYHLERGDKVHVVDNLSTGDYLNIKPYINNQKFTFNNADLLNWDGLENTVHWADRIYHLAAVVGVFRVLDKPISVLETNILGCERLLRAMRNNQFHTKLITASTSEVYGAQTHDNRLHEDLELLIRPGVNTRWNYAISKLADEAFSLSYCREYDTDITVVRFFNVIGPNQTGKYGMVIPRFVKQAVRNEPISVFGDGSQVRAFMDVRDCINILQKLAENDATKCQVVNVGTAREITIGELSSMVKQRAESESKIEYTPYDQAYGVDFEEIYHRKPDLTKMRALTGYQSQWRLEDTLDLLIENQRQIEVHHGYDAILHSQP